MITRLEKPLRREVLIGKRIMKRILRENGLSIVWLGLFLVTFLIGQTVTGCLEYNSEQREHGRPELTCTQYVTTPHFVEATMEN